MAILIRDPTSLHPNQSVIPHISVGIEEEEKGDSSKQLKKAFECPLLFPAFLVDIPVVAAAAAVVLVVYS